ncbi:aspartate--tRNA(Asn) ligase [candidate division WWE3 bacterium]|jgi:aspartyl-tRNA synthetase|uniref:Aspartate--tRNA(Asp/Asn) ligase n=1 Tax=candidate division WWE3 bacterium TaxID=2053526 RepID=A0A3A4ZBA2_UNCKA|nr:MAG: aspartate--tRNA(Asn) ligase [candidate division WWE3 bacterium]
MERTHIKNLKTKVGETVIVKGFVHAIRDQGGIKFLLIRDVTGIIQVVVLKSESEAFELVKELTLESVVSIEGRVKEEKQAPDGFELQALKISILSKADPELPIPVVIEKGGEEPEVTKRFDWRWIDLRRSERQEIFKIWTELEAGFRDYYEKNGFFQIYAPSFMSSPSESGADVFEVNYFDRKAYLAQSPQFYKQMAMAAGFEKVFMTGPVFRAEPSFTTRHMTEFTGWDFEISYIDSHYDVMKVEEELIISGFNRLNEKLDLGLEIPVIPFPKVSMAEAKEMLKQAGIEGERELDLSPEEERELSRIVKEKYNHDFIFVTAYPSAVRPFYHMRDDSAESLTKSFDLLYKGIEITTGAQREHRFDVLERQAMEKGMDLASIREYLDFFKYGCPPHGGVGIGPGRLIMKLLELPSVKEATFLPRDVKRLKP